VKPVDRFVDRWAELAAEVLAGTGPFRLTVIGAGAAGTELSLCLQYRLARALESAGGDPARLEITLLSDRPEPLPDHAPPVSRAMRRFLEARNVRLAAGDIAAFSARRLPKSGVYAVRQGPALARNLCRAARDRPLKPYRPQRRTLALISSGNPYAIASYGPLALEGAWAWRLKDWIDRRWMRKYQELPKMAEAADSADGSGAFEMRCGGCGAKVASPVLSRVLGRLSQQSNADVVVGLAAPNDAAVLAPPVGKLLVQTVDHFRAFIDDPYLFGRITVNHCLGDIYAMGAAPRTAQALVSLPYGPEAKVERPTWSNFWAAPSGRSEKRTSRSSAATPARRQSSPSVSQSMARPTRITC
jgi:hypothetical protein